MSRRSGSRDPDLLTFGNVAKLLGLDDETGWATVQSYVRAGAIAAVEVKPGVTRIHRSEAARLSLLMLGTSKGFAV